MPAYEHCLSIKDALLALEALPMTPRARVALRKHHNAAAATILDHGAAMGLAPEEVEDLSGGTKEPVQ
jgi:hypothetical protein